MDITSVMVTMVLSIMVVVGTLQGIAIAYTQQALLKQKTTMVLETQGIGNILTDNTACTTSIGTQTILYSNGTVAYKSGDGVISNFIWSTQGTTNVLTIVPTNSTLKPVVLNLSCQNSNTQTNGNNSNGNTQGTPCDNRGN